MEGVEGGVEPEFNNTPSQGPSQTSQAEYIRAPAQGLPTDNDTNRIIDTPNKYNYTNQPALTILFKMLREDGRPLPVGSFTERSVARRVYGLTGVAIERVTMVTLIDALVDQITVWEDIPVWVSVLMGNRQYITKLCQERVDHEEQKKAMEAEVERMQEHQQKQQDKLSELIDKVSNQVHMGEM